MEYIKQQLITQLCGKKNFKKFQQKNIDLCDFIEIHRNCFCFICFNNLNIWNYQKKSSKELMTNLQKLNKFQIRNYYFQYIIYHFLDLLQMQIFSNTKYQGLKDLVNIPLLNYSTITNFRNDLENQITQRNFVSQNKVGFVPFKITKQGEIQTSTLNILEEQSGSSENSMLITNEQNSQPGVKISKIKKGPYRKYTLQQKMRAVLIMNSEKDLKSVAKLFNIPRRNLLRWRKNGCQRKERGGRPTDSVMQDSVWEMLKQGMVETQKQIRQLAKKLSSFKNFKASKGWFVKFCQRYCLDPHNIKPIEKQNL